MQILFHLLGKVFADAARIHGLIFLSLTSAVILSCEDARTQSLDTLWSRTFGGTNIDVGHSVEEASDKSLIITGYTRSFGSLAGRNVWLVKTSREGVLQWMNTFGGSSDDEGYSVVQTNDGGFAVAGYTSSFGAGGKDVYLVRTDSLGNQLWSANFGGAQDDEGYSLLQTSDGGFLIAGVSSSFTSGSRDVWLVKTNASGVIQWSRNHGGLSSDGAWSVELSADGGFIVAGWTFSYGPGAVGNAWLVKTDSAGNLQWQKPFGGTSVDRALDVCLAGGGYALTGYTSSSGSGLDDMLLIRTVSLGNEIWTRTFGGSGRDYGQSITRSSDGNGFLIAGYTLSFGSGSEDVWIVRTDGNGNMLWSRALGGSASDAANSVHLTYDGGAVVAGYTLSYGAGVHDLWLIRLAPAGTNIGIGGNENFGTAGHFELKQNYPNPFNPATTVSMEIRKTSRIELVIYDILGRNVRTLFSGTLQQGPHTELWNGLNDNGDELPGGVYYCVLKSDSYSETKAMLLLK